MNNYFRSVEFIKSDAFGPAKIDQIRIEEGNADLTIEHYLLIDLANRILIDHFADSKAIEIGCRIGILDSSCFKAWKLLS
jgi:hypothetical protein